MVVEMSGSKGIFKEFVGELVVTLRQELDSVYGWYVPTKLWQALTQVYDADQMPSRKSLVGLIF